MVDVPGVTNWPAAPDTLATLIQVRDLASTVLTADIDDNDMTLNVGSTSGWPSASIVTIDGEHIIYSGKTGTSVTVVQRGAYQSFGGSAAAPHDAGATVAFKVIAITHHVLADAILALQAKQGAGSDTPVAGDFFKGTGAGTSGWAPLAGSEVNTALGYTAASDAALTAHTAASNPHSGAQPLDAELTALAGLTSAADRLPYFTGSSAAALATFTAAGRALVDDADAAAQRTTLGLLGMAQQGAGAVAITGGSIVGITDLALADGGTGASDSAGARTNLGLVIGTNVQAQDAELQALAGLTSAADKGIQFTGAGTAGTYDLTAAGKALLDDADATAQRATLGLGTIATQAASAVAITGGAITGITDLAVADGGTGASNAAGARTNLGLVIGTDVQAQDAELQAIAGLTSAADRLPYFTGAGTAGLATFTAAGRALIDDADATAQRATLGLVIGTDVPALAHNHQNAAGGGLLLPAAMPSMGMVLIDSDPFSASSAVNVDGVFGSDFENYLLHIVFSMSAANVGMNIRFRAAGVSISATNYYYELSTSGGAIASSGPSPEAPLLTPGGSGVTWTDVQLVLWIRRPALTDETIITGTNSARFSTPGFRSFLYAGGYNATTQFDGFSVFPGSGTITGSYRVYGLRD